MNVFIFAVLVVVLSATSLIPRPVGGTVHGLSMRLIHHHGSLSIDYF